MLLLMRSSLPPRSSHFVSGPLKELENSYSEWIFSPDQLLPHSLQY